MQLVNTNGDIWESCDRSHHHSTVSRPHYSDIKPYTVQNLDIPKLGILGFLWIPPWILSPQNTWQGLSCSKRQDSDYCIPVDMREPAVKRVEGTASQPQCHGTLRVQRQPVGRLRRH